METPSLTDGNDTTNQYFNENAGRTRIPTQISQDAVQEFQVLIDGYSAEFGRASGGVVNTVTRSGSNLMHGSVYWFFRNQAFNARDPFAATNPPETRHQAGASLGGRIVPNKLFYFFNGETTRRDFPLSASISTPPFFDANGHLVMTQPDGRPTCGAPATGEQCAKATSFFDRQFRLLSRQANTGRLRQTGLAAQRGTIVQRQLQLSSLQLAERLAERRDAYKLIRGWQQRELDRESALWAIGMDLPARQLDRQ